MKKPSKKPRVYGYIIGSTNSRRLRGYYEGEKGDGGEPWYTDERGRGWSAYDVTFIPSDKATFGSPKRGS
jgi:hypothetical protein